MKYKKTLYSWLTNRFLLIIRNEENFAEKKTFSFTYAKLIVFAISLLLIFIALSFYVVSTFLSHWYNPKAIEVEANRKIISLSAKVDSLSIEVERKDQYIQAFKRILEGKEDSLILKPKLK